MKQNVSPVIIIAIIAVFIVVMGIVVHQVFFKNPNVSSMSGEQLKEYQDAKAHSAIRQNMHSGGGSRGAYTQ